MTRQALAGIVAVAGLLACVSTPPSTLDQARAAYREAEQDPLVQRYASVALYEAQQTLGRAEEAWADGEDADEVAHLAYLVEQKVAIARENARHRELEERAQAIGAEPGRIRVESLEQELAELKARQTDRGLVVTLEDVLFAFDRADLQPGSEIVLDRVAQFLVDHPDRSIEIEGHTDAVGSNEYNERLSRERAESVASYLERRGIDRARIDTAGFGETRPLVANTSPAARQQNRRVEIVIENPPQGASRQGGAEPSSRSGSASAGVTR
jgi:outer membrane protein OmpA-like peptidoglycan-associated protein